MSENGGKPNNELFVLNDMLEGVEPAEESLDDILAEVYGRPKPSAPKEEAPAPEAPSAPAASSDPEESGGTTATESADEAFVPIRLWQAGAVPSVQTPPVVRDDDPDQPDVLSGPKKQKGTSAGKGKIVTFPTPQQQPPSPSPWKEPDPAALPQDVLDAVFADIPRIDSDNHRPDGFTPSKLVKAKDLPAAPDKHEDYRAKAEPEEPSGERMIEEKEGPLDRLRSGMDRFADSMFSQAASTDEATEIAERYIPGTDEEITPEPEPESEQRPQRREKRPRRARPVAEDIPPQKLSRKYFRGLNLMNRRIPLLVILTLMNSYLTIAADCSFPLPALLRSGTKSLAVAGLILFSAAIVCSIDIILKGFTVLKQRMFTLHTLGSITVLFVFADAVAYCLFGRSGPAAYTAPGTLLLLCLTWGYYDKKVADYRACRQASYAASPYRVTKCEKLWNNRDTFTKTAGDSRDFSSQLQAPTEADLIQSRTAPVLFVLALLLAVLISARQGALPGFLWYAAAILLASCPVSALLGYGQPWLRLTRRMEQNGGAIAGWPGVHAAGSSDGVLISDGDLFPSGTVQFNGIKVYGDISLEKLAGCSASLIRASGSGLDDLFDGLVRTQGGFYRRVDDFQCYEAGGLSGNLRGEQVMIGTASFMRVMDIPLPQDLKVNNAIFCAIDGSLRGIFALNYAKTVSVRPSVSSLLHARLIPILAPRDFNITPAMVRQKLRIPVERLEYPPVERRLELTEPNREQDGILCALLNRDSLEAYSAALVGCRRLRSAVRLNNILCILSSVIGLALSCGLAAIQATASLAPSNVLVFLTLWLIPTLLISGTVNRY